MRGINKVTLVGNLGKDPENTVLEHHKTVTKFSLATTESYKDDKGETHTSTEWHTIVLWGSLATLAHTYLKKGSLIYLEGKLKTRSYESEERTKKYVTEIIGETLLMLDKKE